MNVSTATLIVHAFIEGFISGKEDNLEIWLDCKEKFLTTYSAPKYAVYREAAEIVFADILKPEVQTLESKIYYRVAHKDSKKGLWYDSDGTFTGLIHNELNFCVNSDLPMPFDPDLVGWLSVTDSLKDLFNWFPKSDIKLLENYGFFITVYEATKAKQYKNHLVICQASSVIKGKILLQDLWETA